jgi:hypothetical protein
MTSTGFGAEDMARGWGPLIAVMRRFMRSPERGAETAVYLASSADVDGVSGAYFTDRAARRSHASSYDRAATVRLRQVSADLVGLAARDS